MLRCFGLHAAPCRVRAPPGLGGKHLRLWSPRVVEVPHHTGRPCSSQGPTRPSQHLQGDERGHAPRVSHPAHVGRQLQHPAPGDASGCHQRLGGSSPQTLLSSSQREPAARETVWVSRRKILGRTQGTLCLGISVSGVIAASRAAWSQLRRSSVDSRARCPVCPGDPQPHPVATPPPMQSLPAVRGAAGHSWAHGGCVCRGDSQAAESWKS